MHHVRVGRGRPLLLLHGLGGSWRSWSTILDALAGAREVVVPDLRSARPWALPADVTLTEMRTFAAGPSFILPLLRSLVHGPAQAGAPAGSTPGPITIGWGRHDRVCLPRQAPRAMARFPGARLHWFERSGHFSQWDTPEETVEFILRSTG